MNQYWSLNVPILIRELTSTGQIVDQYWFIFLPPWAFCLLEQDWPTAPRYSLLAHDTALHQTTSSKWSETIEVQDYSNSSLHPKQ